MRRPLSVQPGCEPVIDFAPGVPKYLDEVEYRWEPYVYSPGYKLERKNFTPTNSPPLSPIRGMGTGPLDEVAKRQTRYLITPSPDGSHRPKPAFGGPRATPSGGFYPHAPNAIKIVKKKLLHAARTPSPIVGEGDVDDVEVIHERNYHLLGDSASPSRSPERISRAHNERIAPSSSHRSTHYTRGRQPNVADWEKIYDLPPHSSTVTIKDVPPNVDVKRRLAQFEGVMPYFDTAHRSKIGRDEDARSKVSSDRRLGSPTAQQRYQDAEHRRTPLQRQPRHNFVTEPKEQRYRSEAGTTLLRRFNAPATAVHVDTTVDQAQRSNTTSSRRKHNNTPTSIQQQEQHPQTAVQRRLQRQTTTPSPSAPSYERAHVYGPPALPSGHRRTPSPVTGYHTRNSTPSTSRERTERTVHAANEPKKGVTDEEQRQMMRKNLPLLTKQEQNADLDELARLNEKLLERSRGRRADYKLVDSEIVKTAPEPVPPSVKQPRTNPATVIQEQIREMLESRISNDTSVNSTIPQQDRSGYVTDVSSATWQFSTQSFSPRSVVSINGGAKTDDGLLKVRTDLSPGLSRTISRSNAAVQTANVIENEKQSWPYMPAQLGTAADSAHSTITREFNETYTRRIDRYASLPTLDASDARGTLIKIKDDKPRGIMKRRELETKDQMMYADQQPRNLVTQNHWEQREVVQTKPKVTETVQKFEEHKRTEEIERRVQRKERREKKHRSAQRSYHHSGGQEMLGYSDGEQIRIRKAREAAENELLRREALERSRRLAESQQRRTQHSWADSVGSRNEYRRNRAEEEQKRLEYERRKADEERRRAELERRRLEEQRRRRELEQRSRAKLVEEHESSESLMRSRVARSVQTDPVPRARSRSADPVPRVQRIYERRHFSPSELNDAVRNAYRAVDQAYKDLRYRSNSLSRNGYLPAHESYMRTVTTRRERDGVSFTA
ncbi:hypothetical protein Tcan_07001 [Toxocara canis]|uniref:Uncharacterized protein n=1 Tax=Toxocara canis TaxID=6265 RepID=A0A0B2V854_TOXCA|nr:hypothetical protein Tcan_07001 [Toxocara canis]